jgi:ubiquinone/menaquinone biosynthesis C-methylase UbiE
MSQRKLNSSEADTWDRLANRYDQSVKLFDRSYSRVRELLRRDLSGLGHVLEVASGTGQFTLALAEVVTQLTATDISKEMVERLRVKLVEQQVDNVATEVRSAYELGVGDGLLDGIFCANALHVMETPQRALAEFHRALKPEGRLVIPTFCHGIDRRRRLLSWFVGVVTPFVAHTRFTPASLEEMVVGNGFRVVEITTLPGKFPLAYVLANRE